MYSLPKRTLIGGVLLACALAVVQAQSGAVQRIDLAEQLAAGKLRVVNRELTRLQGSPGGVHMSQKEGNGIAWVEGTDFANGTIEMDIRGRDVFQQSFVGIAFHRKADDAYESVYLRPFNFRAEDPLRHQHAVQYMAVPDFDWPRLRKEFPGRVREPCRCVRRPDRLGARPRCREGTNNSGVRRTREIAHARSAQARTVRSRDDRPVGRKRKRRRLREPPSQL